MECAIQKRPGCPWVCRSLVSHYHPMSHYTATGNCFACPVNLQTQVSLGMVNTSQALALWSWYPCAQALLLTAQAYASVIQSGGLSALVSLSAKSCLLHSLQNLVWSPKSPTWNLPQANFTQDNFIPGASLSLASEPCPMQLISLALTGLPSFISWETEVGVLISSSPMILMQNHLPPL